MNRFEQDDRLKLLDLLVHFRMAKHNCPQHFHILNSETFDACGSPCDLGSLQCLTRADVCMTVNVLHDNRSFVCLDSFSISLQVLLLWSEFVLASVVRVFGHR